MIFYSNIEPLILSIYNRISIGIHKSLFFKDKYIHLFNVSIS